MDKKQAEREAQEAWLTNEEILNNSEEPSREELAVRKNDFALHALNVLAEQTLLCLKLCQNERPKAQGRAKRKTPLPVYRQDFAYKFALQLNKVENAFDTYAFASGRSSIWQHQVIADLDTNTGSEIVDIRVLDDQLLIRMPYLSPAGKFPRCSLPTEILRSKLVVLNLPKWQKWNAEFCQVYSSEDFPFARDVDNNYYKDIIDTLTLYLGTTDKAGYFSMSADAIADDSIPGGTYIRVTPKREENPVIRTFKNIQKSSENRKN